MLHSTQASPLSYSATFHYSLTTSTQCYTPLQPHLLHTMLHSTTASPPYSATLHYNLTSSIQCYTPLQPHHLHTVLHSTTASPPPYSATLHYSLTSSIQCYTPLQPHLLQFHMTKAFGKGQDAGIRRKWLYVVWLQWKNKRLKYSTSLIHWGLVPHISFSKCGHD